MNKEDRKNVLALLGLPVAVILMIIVMLPLGIFNAWALQKMYIWFLLPLGLPALNLWHVFGIMLMITHFKNTSERKESGRKTIGRIIVGIILTLLMLLIGYFLKGHI